MSMDLSINNTFYTVEESNNVFRRDKIHKVIEGVDWFTYSMPIRTYSIVKYTVLGNIKVVLNGAWSSATDYLEPKAYVSVAKEGENSNQTIDNDWLSYTTTYSTLAEAEAVVIQKNEEARLMDIPT